MRLLFLLLIPIYGFSQKPVIDSFARGGVMYYSTDQRGLAVREFWPKVKEMEEEYWTISAGNKFYKKPNLYLKPANILHVVVLSKAVFELKTKRGKSVLKDIIDGHRAYNLDAFARGYYQTSVFGNDYHYSGWLTIDGNAPLSTCTFCSN